MNMYVLVKVLLMERLITFMTTKSAMGVLRLTELLCAMATHMLVTTLVSPCAALRQFPAALI